MNRTIRYCIALLMSVFGTAGCGTLPPVSAGYYEEEATYYSLLILTNQERRADKRIVKQIKLAIKNHFGKQTKLKIHSHNGVVLLLGELPIATDIAYLEALAGEVVNVKRIYNFIEPQDTPKLSHDSADGWASLQARLALAQLPDNLQGRIQLTVHNGIIYVLGIIRKREKILLHNTVSELHQVRKLVLLTEIID